MEKDKMIEELVSIIGEWSIKNRMCWDSMHAESLAKYLIEKNVLKVHEGSIVLTKEEYERLKSDRKIKVVQHLDDEFIVEMPQCEYDEMLEQASKETAKDILQTLYNNLERPYFFNEYIKTLAKRYGVEEEE